MKILCAYSSVWTHEGVGARPHPRLLRRGLPKVVLNSRFFVSQHVAIAIFLIGPCLVFLCADSLCFLDTARMKVDAIQDAVYSMSQWWKGNRWREAWLEPWSWEGAQEDEEISRRLKTVPKERDSLNTLTESCESDETEVEEVKPFGAPPGLAGPPGRRNKDPRAEDWVPD